MTTFPHPARDPAPCETTGLALTLPARPESVAAARRAVMAYARTLGLDEDTVADVALALSEACANVVVHAYRAGDPAKASFAVRAGAADGGLRIVIGDRGLGMVPRTDSPGLGLGLPLMASLATSLELRETEGGGTEVWMTFALAGARQDAPLSFGRTG